MTILVTGANGFVGSALCAKLHHDAVPVRGAIRTLQPQRDSDQVIAVGEISTETDWTAALKDVKQVVHLAARAHVMNDKCAEPLSEFRRVNVSGAANLARQAAAAGVRRFVFLSTIKVNGEFTEEGKTFTANDVPAPQDPYGASKHEAEQVLRQIAGETGMELVVIRPPLVYGPGVKGNFLSLMQAIDKRRPLPLGAIQNRRSLIYVGNLVDIIRLCLTHPKAAGKVFLASDGNDLSTPELVRRLAASMGRRPFIVPLPTPWMRFAGWMLGKQASVDRVIGSLAVDTTPLRDELGWQPCYTIQAGLEATALWYQKKVNM